MAGTSVHPLLAEDAASVAAAKLPWEKLAGATVLVTGAAGMAGSCIVRTLVHLNDTLNLGIRISALARNPEKAQVKLRDMVGRSDVTLLSQDVTDPVDCDGAVDFIFHAASPANPRYFSTDPVGTIQANALGTYHLLELARRKRTQKFILLSSAEIYGSASGEAPLGEDVPGVVNSAAARSCYPESKRLGETYCAAYMQQYGIGCHAARIAHMYGPGIDRDDGHVIAEFIRCLLDGRDIVLKSDGSTRRAYIYITDVVKGLFTVLLKGETLAYNITNESQVVSIRELAELIIGLEPEQRLKLTFDIPPAAANTGFLPHGVGLIGSSRLRSLGWQPEVSLSDGVRRTVTALRG